MKIVNATAVTKTYFLGDGTPVVVNPGSFSESILGTAKLIEDVIKSGTVKEVGIVIASEYELAEATKITGCTPFIYHNEEVAKAKLIEGKEFTVNTSNSSNAVTGLKIELQKKDEEIENLRSQLADAKSEAEQAKLEIKPLNDEILQLKKDKVALENELNSEKETRLNLKSSNENLNAEVQQLTTDNANLEAAVKNKDTQIEKLNNDIEELKTEGQKISDKNDEYRGILNDIVGFYNMEQDKEGKWRIPDKAAKAE
jgi:chromosome segregation ATPase